MRQSNLLFALLLAVACSDAKPPEVKISDALPNIPLPPNASIVSREAGTDAIKIRFRTPLDAAETAQYYRNLLSAAPYNLVSDTKAGLGYALYAENPGQPSLWVTITPDSVGGGTLVDLAGARSRP